MENAAIGDLVEFHGLNGAAHLNGTTGNLGKFNEIEQRWAVRCDDTFDIVQAKPTNLLLLKRSDAPTLYSMTNPITGKVEYMKPRTTSVPVPNPSSLIDAYNNLHEAVVGAFHNRRKGGVVVSCGKKYMMSIEFDGPYGNGGIYGEMVYVDKDPSARAVVQQRGCARATELGRNFLSGETIEYIDTNEEDVFFKLLSQYKRRCSTKGHTDIKSGLRLYNVEIAK
eukprot:scaffold728_cov197-Chaetoceros_neogracile.AAC.2